MILSKKQKVKAIILQGMLSNPHLTTNLSEVNGAKEALMKVAKELTEEFFK